MYKPKSFPLSSSLLLPLLELTLPLVSLLLRLSPTIHIVGLKGPDLCRGLWIHSSPNCLKKRGVDRNWGSHDCQIEILNLYYIFSILLQLISY